MGEAVHAGLNAVEAAKRLAKVGLESNEAADLVKTIAQASTRGPAKAGGITVLGHGPDYVQKARELGATYFLMDSAAWDALVATDKKLAWGVNQKFLDDAIARGDEFILATELERRPSFFEDELRYLLEHGYELVGDRMVRK